MSADCTFLYFKSSGKWKYEGRGVFPPEPFLGRDDIIRANGGALPGLRKGYLADDLIIVVCPDDSCEAQYAFPRILLPEDPSPRRDADNETDWSSVADTAHANWISETE